MKYLSIIYALFFLGCSSISPISTKSKEYAGSVPKSYIDRLDFHGEELIVVPDMGNYYYVHKNGKKMLALTYKGTADKFSEGLARTKVEGKIGFFNKNLEMVLQPLYDFAFPFYKGKAEICTGCKESPVDGTMMLDGGTWKKIDRSGLIIE